MQPGWDSLPGEKWSERQDLNLRRLGPKPSALARLSYAPSAKGHNIHITPRMRNEYLALFFYGERAKGLRLWFPTRQGQASAGLF